MKIWVWNYSSNSHKPQTPYLIVTKELVNSKDSCFLCVCPTSVFASYLIELKSLPILQSHAIAVHMFELIGLKYKYIMEGPELRSITEKWEPNPDEINA